VHGLTSVVVGAAVVVGQGVVVGAGGRQHNLMEHPATASQIVSEASVFCENGVGHLKLVQVRGTVVGGGVVVGLGVVGTVVASGTVVGVGVVVGAKQHSL